MSHPTFWPKKVFYYPIGNTAPVCLTDWLPPTQDAKILLLGCGDPRNILYTAAVDHGAPKRELDITCCDLEPAIIARNVLLLTLILDSTDGDDLATYWNIIYDAFLDQWSTLALKDQCSKLISYARDIATWNASPYGCFISFLTEDSLDKTRQLWHSYIDTIGLPGTKQKEMKQSFTTAMQDVLQQHEDIPPRRAAVPLSTSFPQSLKMYTRYWQRGHSGVSSNLALLINPTFMFSLAGRQFNLHYATDLCSSFHLAPILAQGKLSMTERDVWTACRAQFDTWCIGFRGRVISESGETSRPLMVRFAVGDALAFCDALRLYRLHQFTPTVYTSPWGGCKFDFKNPSKGSPIPTSFNLIDTSNLSDHLGLLNVIVATLPLLERDVSSTLNTNLLIPYVPKVGSARGFIEERVMVDLHTFTLLLGIIPTCYATGFTFRNDFEAIALGGNYQRLSWKFCHFAKNAWQKDEDYPRGIQVDEGYLADKLFSLYLNMFEVESKDGSIAIVVNHSIPHYHRESFVRFVRLLQTTVLEVNWDRVMDNVVDRIASDRSLMTGSNSCQDLLAHLYMYGILTTDRLNPSHLKKLTNKCAPYQSWTTIPPVVCIVLLVPRSALEPLEGYPTDRVGHPILECSTASTIFHSLQSSIRPIFGDVIVSGPHDVTIREDPRGLQGDSPLVVSFYIPAWILTKDPESIKIGLGLKSTPSTARQFVPELGPFLNMFSAKLLDSKHVFILPSRPDNPSELPKRLALNAVIPSQHKSRTSTVRVFPNGQGRLMLTQRLDIKGIAGESLRNGAVVEVKQFGPFSFEVCFGEHRFPLHYPVPVDGTLSKTRIARKSGYIEVDVPAQPDPKKQFFLQPFPVLINSTGGESNPVSWNTPYVNLDTSPILLSSSTEWVFTHGKLSFSHDERELVLSRSQYKSVMTPFKESIRGLFYMFITEQKRYVLLADPEGPPLSSRNDGRTMPHAFLLLHDLKFDLTSGAVIFDAAVIFPTRALLPLLIPFWLSTHATIIKTTAEEVILWKHAFPAFAERCRQWKHLPTCDYIQRQSIPLSQEYSESPLCSCGKGKDMELFGKEAQWKDFIPHATRVALSLVFPVPYLETATGSPVVTVDDMLRCPKCGGKGKPKLLTCGGCKAMRYCSKECQAADWKKHKTVCKTLSQRRQTAVWL